jgi:hypothetical protein
MIKAREDNDYIDEIQVTIPNISTIARYEVTRRHNPEDLDLNLRRRENLSSPMKPLAYGNCHSVITLKHIKSFRPVALSSPPLPLSDLAAKQIAVSLLGNDHN